MTVEDLSTGKVLDDSIAVSSYGWDLPDPHKPSYQPMHNIKKPTFTHIPYRCMVPKTVENLIVAGRSISVERDVLGPIRVMAPCMAMGEAAGLAASLAVKKGVAFKDVDIALLQRSLDDNGCIYQVTV